MRKLIVVNPKLGLEDLQNTSIFKEFELFEQNQQPQNPEISTESLVGALGGLFKSTPRIGAQIDPIKLRYHNDDLSKVIKVMRDTALNSKWVETVKIRGGKTSHPNLFNYLIADGKFDINDPINFIRNSLTKQRDAFSNFAKEVATNGCERMLIHADLQHRWAKIPEDQKTAEVEQALSKIFEASTLSESFAKHVKPGVTVNASCRIVPGSQYPVVTVYKPVVTYLPHLEREQLTSAAELIVELAEHCLNNETPTMYVYDAAYNNLSHLMKSDQVLTWLYQNDRHLFASYATLIFWEEDLKWVSNKITEEITALRIMLSWMIDSVKE